MKSQAYKAYLASPHVQQGQVIMIVDDALTIISPQFLTFKDYLMGEFANKSMLKAGILNRMQGFDEPGEALFYLAYLAEKYAYSMDSGAFKTDVIELINGPVHLKG